MTREELRNALYQGLIELQERTGLPRPELGEETSPVADLPEFDSLKCVELEVLLSERLGFEVENVLIPEDEPDAELTIEQILDRLEDLTQSSPKDSR